MEDFFPVLVEMRKGLTEKCARLTPISSRSEQEDYFNSLIHYRKIFNNFVSQHSQDLQKAIEKAHTNVIMLNKVDG
jgi:hypothetical protein